MSVLVFKSWRQSPTKRTKTKTFVLVMSLEKAVLNGSTKSLSNIFINVRSMLLLLLLFVDEGQGSVNCFFYNFLI